MHTTRSTRCSRTTFVILVSLFYCCVLNAQAPTAQAPTAQVSAAEISPDEDAAAAKKAYREKLIAFAKSFTVFGSDERKEKAVLTEQPIFTWSNPERQTVGGALFMWTLNGRPHTTMGVWNYTHKENSLSYEMQSLSPNPFDVTHTTEDDWLPRSAGLDFVKIADASTPATTKVRRNLQMKQLAQEFSATLYETEDNEIQLRLLPQPIYRYGKETPDQVIDGAMFSFAQGTDPEVFLIFEARERSEKKSWFFAMAPSTIRKVTGKHGGKSVMTNNIDANGHSRDNTMIFRSQRSESLQSLQLSP